MGSVIGKGGTKIKEIQDASGARLNASEINFLTIHRKLRNKRLAPVLIKEVTRRCYLNGVYQALYTAGTLLPTPVSTCRYYHRSLDWQHLYETGFSHLPHGSSALRMKYKYKLEEKPTLKGLRPMVRADAPAGGTGADPGGAAGAGTGTSKGADVGAAVGAAAGEGVDAVATG